MSILCIIVIVLFMFYIRKNADELHDVLEPNTDNLHYIQTYFDSRIKPLLKCFLTSYEKRDISVMGY